MLNYQTKVHKTRVALSRIRFSLFFPNNITCLHKVFYSRQDNMGGEKEEDDDDDANATQIMGVCEGKGTYCFTKAVIDVDLYCIFLCAHHADFCMLDLL